MCGEIYGFEPKQFLIDECGENNATIVWCTRALVNYGLPVAAGLSSAIMIASQVCKFVSPQLAEDYGGCTSGMVPAAMGITFVGGIAVGCATACILPVFSWAAIKAVGCCLRSRKVNQLNQTRNNNYGAVI